MVKVEDVFLLRKGKKMEDSKENAQLKQLDREAYQLGMDGNTLGALEVIEKAMEIEKRWYHLYAKASYSYKLSERNIEASWKAIQEGISRFPDQRFWFLYIRADLQYRVVHMTLQKDYSLQSIRDKASDAQQNIANAYSIAQTSKDKILPILRKPPLLLPEIWHGINFNALLQRVVSFQNEISSTYRTVNMLLQLEDIETNVERKIEAQKIEMHADKMRTIEILGVFTAIMAFIILFGTVAFKTTYNEAMPILGVLCLVLILLVTVASLVTSVFYRYRDICKDVRTWLAFSIIIILGVLIWNSQKQNPDAILTNKFQSRPTVEAVEQKDKTTDIKQEVPK